MQSNTSTTVVQEVDISTIVNLRRLVDVAMQLMPLQTLMIQIEVQICTSYQLIMASLESLSTTTPNKKVNASMIMELELVEENKIGSAIELAKRLVIMISAAMHSR
jgi:hypothetical protein